MNWFYLFGAVLAGVVAIAHSYLGERYIIARLLRRPDLPKLRGSDQFTRLILRLAWHLTSLAWAGFAAVFLYAAIGKQTNVETVIQIVGVTFALHAIVTFIATRGKHLAWLIFSGIAVAAYIGSRGHHA